MIAPAEIAAPFDLFAKGSATALVLLAMRIGGLVLIAPVFSAKPIPAPLKAALIVLFAVLLQPAALLHASPNMSITFESAFAETMVGFALGLGAAIIVGAADAAGELIAIQVGLSGAAIFDPMSGQQGPALAQFCALFAVALMLSLDLHLVMLDAVATSTRVIPLGQGMNMAAGARAMVASMSQLFGLGLRFAAPVIAVVLVANVALAILTRAAPQLNILSVAFPVQIGAGLVAFAATIPVISLFFNGWTSFYNGAITRTIGALAAVGVR